MFFDERHDQWASGTLALQDGMSEESREMSARWRCRELPIVPFPVHEWDKQLHADQLPLRQRQKPVKKGD